MLAPRLTAPALKDKDFYWQAVTADREDVPRSIHITVVVRAACPALWPGYALFGGHDMLNGTVTSPRLPRTIRRLADRHRICAVAGFARAVAFTIPTSMASHSLTSTMADLLRASLHCGLGYESPAAGRVRSCAFTAARAG